MFSTGKPSAEFQAQIIIAKMHLVTGASIFHLLIGCAMYLCLRGQWLCYILLLPNFYVEACELGLVTWAGLLRMEDGKKGGMDRADRLKVERVKCVGSSRATIPGLFLIIVR